MLLLAASSSWARLGGRRGLLEVLEAELEMVGIQLLRAPPKLRALLLPDQEPQLLKLGLRRVVLLTNEVALSKDNIALGLQGCELDIFLVNNFNHLL